MIEEYRKNSNDSEIQFMENNRFYFKVIGNNISLEETWDAVKDLDAEKLG